MENTKTREQSVDTDPMYDNREVVTDAEAEMEREQTADNMSEDDAPETDKSAETAGAQSAGTAPFRTSSGNGRTNTCVWWPSSTTTVSGRTRRKRG